MSGPATKPDAETQAVVIPPHLEKLAWMMDQSIRIPRTQIRVGADSIIGLIPGIGDIIGLIISAWIIMSSVKAGARQPAIIKMLGNVARDAVLGTVPLFGDLFDVTSRANVKNIELLRNDLEAQRNPPDKRAAMIAKLKLWALALTVISILSLAVYGAVQLISSLF